MFTGIIKTVSQVNSSQQLENGLELVIKTPADWTQIIVGESIAANGVCLTVANVHADAYTVCLIPETLATTTFGIKVPVRVNLERAISGGDRFGGHFVQGHVDTTGKVMRIKASKEHTIEIEYPSLYVANIIPKGSITIDGVALTIAQKSSSTFTVALVPHTLQHTTLGEKIEGDIVNIEFDMLGKYVINTMEQQNAKS